MTNISDLPDEVLLMIFKEICDAGKCQKVCRAWYALAHPLFLNKSTLYSFSKVEDFIQSIDHNPRKSYLNAVKNIEFYFFSSTVGNSKLDKEKIKKLFFRFPNLKKIYFNVPLTVIEDFDEEVCNDLLTSCPKLDDIDTYVGHRNYDDLVYKLRYLMTTINLKKVKDVSKFGGVLQFIANFPHLKNIEGDIPVDDIHSFLPTLTKFSKLTTFQLVCSRDDQDGFAEKLDATDQLLKCLSTIKDLGLFIPSDFNLNSSIFVSKYMTGLSKILIGCSFLKTWTDVNQRLCCNSVLDLASAIDECRFEIQMNIDTLAEYFPLMAYKIFQQSESNGEKMPYTTLRININDKETRNVVSIIVITERSKTKHISILVSNNTDLRALMAKVFKKTFHNIDRFKFEIPKRSQISYFSQKITIEMYTNVVLKMPMLKEMELDIPASYKESKELESIETAHVKMGKLVLRATENARFQLLLNSYPLMFPNLKHLEIYYFSGHWKRHMGEFQVELGNYTLTSLVLDMTPVETKMKTHLEKDHINTGDFFVIEATIISIGERWLHKVPFHLSSVTRIQDDDLKTFTRGKDYLSVRITVNSLDKLKICIKDEDCKDEDEDSLPIFSFYMKSITVFDTTAKN